MADVPASRAILIGVSRSTSGDWPPVPAAMNSVAAMARILADPELCGWPTDDGCIVEVPDPGDAIALEIELRELIKDVEGVLLLYFAGHGVKTPAGDLRLVLTGSTRPYVAVNGLSYRAVADALRDSPARLKIVILDCCYSGIAHRTLGAGIEEITQVSGVYVLTASAEHEVAHVPPASEQETRPTSFTEQLIELVESGVPHGAAELTFDALFPHLRLRLRSNGLPEPRQSSRETAASHVFTKNRAFGSAARDRRPPVWRPHVLARNGRSGVAEGGDGWVRSGTSETIYVAVADAHAGPANFRGQRGAQLALRALAGAFDRQRRHGDDWTGWAAEYVADRWQALVREDLHRHPPSIDTSEPQLLAFLDYVRAEHGHHGLELVYQLLRRFPTVEDGKPDDVFHDWHLTAYGVDLVGVMVDPASLRWLHLGRTAAVQVIGGEARHLAEPQPRVGYLSAAAITTGVASLGPGHIPASIMVGTCDEDGFLDLCQDLAGLPPATVGSWLGRLKPPPSIAVGHAEEPSGGRPTAGRPVVPVVDESLRPGTTVRCLSGRALVVGGPSRPRRPGSHGVSVDGRPAVLRWLPAELQRPDVRRNLIDLVERAAPGPGFAWPSDVATHGDEVGYVHPPPPADVVSLVRLLRREVPVGFAEILRVARGIAAVFDELHRADLFLNDLSLGNLLVRPADGHVAFVDVEHVVSPGSHLRTPRTLRYTAPELMDPTAAPSPTTDDHALAVLLFELLMNDHPLHGVAVEQIRCFDAAAMRRVYGRNATFIFDPHDRSNRPAPGAHENAPLFWRLYPVALRRLFTQAFTRGLGDPGQRPSPYQWQLALAAAENSLTPCERCGRGNFLGAAATCWSCSASVQLSSLPGGQVASRPLRFIYVVDTSASMAGHRVGQLNHAIREGLPALRDAAGENPHAAIEMEVLTYGTRVRWHTDQPVPLDRFTWTDVRVSEGPGRLTGGAMRALAAALSRDAMPESALPPVIVLITDGSPTDDFAGGLEEMLAHAWARKAVRVGVAIGDSADLDVLRRFIGRAGIEPLTAAHPEDLAKFVRWVSTQVVGAVSAPLAPPALPDPPGPDTDAYDVW